MLLDAVHRAHADLPRAQLSKLNVHGYGTSLVESGCSFLERVRTEHDVSPRQMRFFMNQQLARYADDVEPRHTMPDSPTESAKAFVNRLAEMTGQPLAARLGLSALADFVAISGTMRMNSAWCPICIRMAALGERENYLPLLWSIGCVEVCPVHNVLLRTRCQICNRRISNPWMLKIRFPFHQCPKCQALLFQETRGVSSRSVRATPVQMRVVNLVGDLVLQLHTDQWGAHLESPDFRQILARTKETGARSGFCGFIERANISKGTASRLLAGERCSLDIYVRVALTAGISLINLFVPDKLEEATRGVRATWSRIDASKRRTADDWPELIGLLKREFTRAMPCSFNQFCRRCEVDYRILRTKIGDLAEKLDAAHNAAIALEQQKMATLIADRLIVEAKQMRSAGICISKRALARRLGKERNNKVFVSAWRLATAASRQERLGSKALPLTRHPPMRR